MKMKMSSLKKSWIKVILVYNVVIDVTIPKAVDEVGDEQSVIPKINVNLDVEKIEEIDEMVENEKE